MAAEIIQFGKNGLSRLSSTLSSNRQNCLLCASLCALPERSLQDGEKASELRDDQILDAGVVRPQPEQVSHQRLYLNGHKPTSEADKRICQVSFYYCHLARDEETV